MYIPGQELKYTLALHVLSFVLFYFACLVVCVCLSLSFLFLLYFSACVILQENSKKHDQPQANVSERRSFIWHPLFLLMLSFLLLPIYPVSRLPKISVWYSTKQFLCKRISQSVLIYLMTLYYYFMGMVPYPNRIEISSSMTGNWLIHSGNVRSCGPDLYLTT